VITVMEIAVFLGAMLCNFLGMLQKSLLPPYSEFNGSSILKVVAAGFSETLVPI
jgi:hypothetical protein